MMILNGAKWLLPGGSLTQGLCPMIAQVSESLPQCFNPWSIRSVNTRGVVWYWTPDKWSFTDALGLLKIFELRGMVRLFFRFPKRSIPWRAIWKKFYSGFAVTLSPTTPFTHNAFAQFALLGDAPHAPQKVYGGGTWSKRSLPREGYCPMAPHSGVQCLCISTIKKGKLIRESLFYERKRLNVIKKARLKRFELLTFRSVV